MIFCTTLYGNDYVKFLYAQIGSIKRNSPESSHYIIYNSVDNEYLDPLKKDKKINLIEANELIVNKKQDLYKIISSKVNFWKLALEFLPDKDVIMLDVDTLINYNFSNNSKFKFDLGFTYKKDRIPINTGVMYLVNSKKIRSFFSNWLELTERIINDPKLLAISISKNHPFGGADQMSFQKLINYDNSNGSYSKNIDGIFFEKLNCNVYNETNSVPYNRAVKVFHYKGSWHNVINNGSSFNKKRTLKDSLSLLIYFEKCLDSFNDFYKISNNYTTLNVPYLVHGKVLKLTYLRCYMFYLVKKYFISIARRVFPKYKQIRI